MTRQLVSSSRRSGRAFTLVELMISVVLVLILVLGINEVFSITGKTIGAGQALSTAQRDNRTGHAVIFEDGKSAVLNDSPFLIIKNERVAAFRNASDRNSDRDYTEADTPAVADNNILSVDFDGDNAEEPSPRTAINGRNHRVDSLRFFARDLFRRQTGNDGSFVSGVKSNEAYITYGHLNLPVDPTNMAGSMEPGKGSLATNPNNFFAQQWILGRNTILLRQPEFDGGSNHFIDEAPGAPGNSPQMYLTRLPNALPAQMTPLSQSSQATINGNPPSDPREVQWSRWDLAGTTLDGYRQVLTTAIAARGLNPAEEWYESVDYRFSGWPFPTKPHSSEGLARTAPCFIVGCSQFVVEFAGDYVTQNPDTGALVLPEGDGEVDYVVQSVDTGAVKRIRWYGFPRNVDTLDDLPSGGERIRGISAVIGGFDLIDVVPVRDVRIAAIAAAAAAGIPLVPPPVPPAPFERNAPTINANYAEGNNVAVGAEYFCAWGPTGTYTDAAGVRVEDPAYPKMLRVTLGIDDPGGRMSDAQIYEYVIDLP